MEGFERGKQIEKLGQHASDTSELFFNDVRVPAENLLGAEGIGLHAARVAPGARAADAGGHVDRRREVAFDLTLDYVKERKAFGRPIGSFQHSRFLLAELKTEIEITRAFVDRTIERYCAGTGHRRGGRDGQVVDDRPARAKVTDAGVQLHGGYGYTTEYPIGEGVGRRPDHADLRGHERDHEGADRPHDGALTAVRRPGAQRGPPGCA